MTAVLSAVEEGDGERLARLLREHPEQAEARAGGGSPVLAALYRGRRDLAEIVLGARPALDGFEAAAVDDVDALERALAADPAFPQARTADGFTALHLAAFFGGTRTAARLLEAGADPGAVAAMNQLQPLHSAAAGGHHEIVRRLLAHGADPDARQEGGFVPLHAAAQAGDAELTRMLLAGGADPELRDDAGSTPADLALRAGHRDVVTLLRPSPTA